MKFSVGKIKLGDQEIAKCTGITVRADGGPVELYAGGYPYPLEIELGNRTLTITVDYAEFGQENPEDILSNEYLTVELMASDYNENRGISGLSITRCKAVTYEITSTQDGFVTYRLELRKAQDLGQGG